MLSFANAVLVRVLLLLLLLCARCTLAVSAVFALLLTLSVRVSTMLGLWSKDTPTVDVDDFVYDIDFRQK